MELTVAAGSRAPVRAVSDAEDRLISADQLLADLQLRCGGELPGTIAVPALLEIVRKARRYRLKLARTFDAHDGTHAVTAWAEVEPRRGDEAGCDIVLRNWHAAPLPAGDPGEAAGLRETIDRQLAELVARLDAGQRVLAAEAEGPDLAPLEAAMQAGIGQRWTDFVTIEGASHQPMHWRLLDGTAVSIAGSARNWRATLLPHGSGNEPTGFDLLLTAEEPLPPHRVRTSEPQAAAEEAGAMQFRGIGREIAPVLRQPIARIIANAETIRTRLAGPLTKEYADYAADIAAAAQHLLGLVDDLADLDVVEGKGFSTAADRIDLAEVAQQAAGILGVRASEKAIVVETPPAMEALPAIAEFRRALQILINLVGNAIRYSPAGSRVRIALEREGAKARVTVIDDGPGLAAKDCERVFEKFERLGRSGDGGSGLGLYISRRLARAMGGDLTVESEPGEGARFALTLPFDASDVADLPGQSPAQPRLARIPGARFAGNGSAAADEPDQD